jgi:hypothetical protein
VGNASTVGVATPSPLRSSGASFSIAYSTQAAASSAAVAARHATVIDGYLVHLGR